MWWLTVTFFLWILSLVSLSFPLIYLPLVCLSFLSVLCLFASVHSSHFSPFIFFTSPSLCISSLLRLFRLCKVQLGFGAFGLQAGRQEDALSEYALLGSLCVTLYFFALLFWPVIFTYFGSYFGCPLFVKSRSSCLPVGFFLWGKTLCFWNHQCPAENWCLLKYLAFPASLIVLIHLIT